MPSARSSWSAVDPKFTNRFGSGRIARGHEDRLWLSDWGTQVIIAGDPDGNSGGAARVPFGFPFRIDWLPDGGLLIVSGCESLLLRRELN